jgi:P4 family phage/plasmid primase-like protien
VNDILLEYFNIKPDRLLSFVHEKPSPTLQCGKNGKPDEYKDGFHVFWPDVPLSFEHRYFVIDVLVEKIKRKNLFKDLPYTNKLTDVLDTTIVMANGTMMYHSAKEGREPYDITAVYNHEMDQIDVTENFPDDELINLMLCRKFMDDDAIGLRDTLDDEDLEDIEERYMKHLSKKEKGLLGLDTYKKPKPKNNGGSFNGQYDYGANEGEGDVPLFGDGDDESDHEGEPTRNKERKMVNDTFISTMGKNEINIAKQLVDLFSDRRATEYSEWVNVGFALHNISPYLMDTFIKFSKRTTRSNFDKQACIDLWKSAKPNRYTLSALYGWAREDNSKRKFDKAILKIISPLIEKALSGTHDDIANMIHAMYRDKYKCVSITNDCWFEFQDHKWVNIESAFTLAEKISSEVAEEFMRYHSVLARKNAIEGGVNRDDNMNKIKKMIKIHDSLKNNGFVNSVMSCCARKFYDGKFEEKLNDNHYLIGFDNGVYDLKSMTFRKGTPDDYITFGVGYDYEPNIDENDPRVKKIMNYFREIHTEDDMCKFLLEFMASCLRGVPDQRFHFWTGSGSNGKSTTIDLLKKLLGDYFGVLPITVLTRKRQNSSGPTPELADKSGKRLLVLNEPEHTDVIYVGQMKELTGSDTIYARGMYAKKGIEYVPQFKLVMPCNNLPPIPARDGGTWRRVRVNCFESEFVEGVPVGKKQFKKDKSLIDEFDDWRAPLMWLLINKYYINLAKNKFNVEEPEKVTEATKTYKKDSDIYFEFMDDYLDITNNEGDSESLQMVYSIFKKWYLESYSDKAPSKKEFSKYIREHTKLKLDKKDIFGVNLLM